MPSTTDNRSSSSSIGSIASTASTKSGSTKFGGGFAKTLAKNSTSTLFLIRDALTGNRISLRVRPADSVHSLYEAVCLNMDRKEDTFRLLLVPSNPSPAAKAIKTTPTTPKTDGDDPLIGLPDTKDRTLADIGVDFTPARQHIVIMRDTQLSTDEMAATIATAVPTQTSAVPDSANVDPASVSSSVSATSTPATSPMSAAALAHAETLNDISPTTTTTPSFGVNKSVGATKIPSASASVDAMAAGVHKPINNTDTSVVDTSMESPPSAATNGNAATSVPPLPAQLLHSATSSKPQNGASIRHHSESADVMDVDQDHHVAANDTAGAVGAAAAAADDTTTANTTAGALRRVPSGTTGNSSNVMMVYDPANSTGSTASTAGTMKMQTRQQQQHLATTSTHHHSFVGLVNQAMTCYLNSLLQALYMTPEFRNALYNWESESQRLSIPSELQKLFLQLQTSTRSAVETTDLTRSFGWDSSEAWHQHDVQELCRVMFDALERTFKRTDQADLINRLYEGKMIDYVRCLECQTEKSREDAFLDIPLPVKPFGSTIAYESVEEAMRGFVEPEKLDGTNQYFCEKCNCKCDAHKGLKFSRFPYILTLHLKRFDFDYNTFHRIKLNDKLTFPQKLNLNHFVKASAATATAPAAAAVPTDSVSVGAMTTNNGSGSTAASEHGSIESAIKSDDCSTTDSDCGILDDDLITSSTTGSNSPNNNIMSIQNNNNNNNNNTINNNNINSSSSMIINNNNNDIAVAGVTGAVGNGDGDLMLMQEDDEGIDVHSTAETKSSISTRSLSGVGSGAGDSHPTTASGAAAAMRAASESGPYIYELFAIMIHSGSASGGHYYAYIKEFETSDWFCFNDQSVTPASQEDIDKSFGGCSSGTKSYYSGAYSSSTNAYMLMYRQLDTQRNAAPMRPEEFPEHIQKLLKKLSDHKESMRHSKIKVHVYWRHPRTRQLHRKMLEMIVTETLDETLAEAHKRLELAQYAPVSQCRLVAFDKQNGERVTRSYDADEMQQPLDVALASLLVQRGSIHPIELLLEMLSADDAENGFEPIQPGSIATQVYRMVDLVSGDVDDNDVIEVRTVGTSTVGAYRQALARRLHCKDADRLVVALMQPNMKSRILDMDDNKIDLENMVEKDKVFVTTVDAAMPDGCELSVEERLLKIVDQFAQIVTLFFVLPNTDKETLKKLSIPSYDESVVTPPPPPTATTATTSPSAALKRSPNGSAGSGRVSGSDDVLMSSTPSPTRPIKIASRSGQWNATCNVDVVDAHMTAAPAQQHYLDHRSNQLPDLDPHSLHHHTFTTQFTVDLSHTSGGLNATDGGGISTSATVRLGGRGGVIGHNHTALGSNGTTPPTECNSEDSSLSDSDRTLVDDSHSVAFGDLCDLSSTHNSPACSDTQVSSPESELERRIDDFNDVDDEDNHHVGGHHHLHHNDEDGDFDGDSHSEQQPRSHYFRAHELDDEQAAAVAADAAASASPSSSSSSFASSSMLNNGGSNSSSTTGEFGPKQQPQRTLKVRVDRGMTMAKLKRALERHVGVPKEYLKIFRQSKTTETECKLPVKDFMEGERLVIELGRALRKGEYRCKVFYMRLADCSAPDFERLQPHACEYVLCSGADVGTTKRAILAELAAGESAAKYAGATYETCRLRQKSFKSPLDVYTDEQKFGEEITLPESCDFIVELILQECDEQTLPCTNPDDKCVFLRRWNPSTYTLSPMQEIVIPYEGHYDLRELIANVCTPSLNVDDIEYMKMSGLFPFTTTSIFSLHTNSLWSDKPLWTDVEPLMLTRSGDMYYYRDKNETVKELTTEDRRTIQRNNDRYSSTTSYTSPRKERGLTIHVDPSPKKANGFLME